MLRKKMRRLTAILLSVLIAGLCQVPKTEVQAAAAAVDGYTAMERDAATLDVTGVSPDFGGFTLASGEAVYNEENAALAVTSTAETATLLKTGLFRPEYRSEYEVTFYIPEGSEDVSLATKLYFRTDMAAGTDAETTSMSFANGTLSYSDGDPQAISDFTGKWITIRQEFLGAYSTITVLDGETTLFASESSLIKEYATNNTVHLNTITSAGLEITGAGTIYIKSADFNTRYYKKNLPFEHEFVFGEQYADRNTSYAGETSTKVTNGTKTKGFFTLAGSGSNSTYNLTSDSAKGNVISLTAGVNSGRIIIYGFFPVDNSVSLSTFGSLIEEMPDYTNGYQILEMDVMTTGILNAYSGSPLYITSSGNLTEGAVVGDPTSHTTLLQFVNNENKIDGLSEAYPTNEWFKLRIILNLNAKTYKTQMIKNDILYESADSALPEALSNGLNATTLVFPRQASTLYSVNIDDVYCYHVTDEQINGDASVSVSGTYEVGETLTATPTGFGDSTVKYQWYRSPRYNYNRASTAVAIEGATSQTYKLTSDDENYFVTVKAYAEENEIVGLPGKTAETARTAASFVGETVEKIDFNSENYGSTTKWENIAKNVNLDNIRIILSNSSAELVDGKAENDNAIKLTVDSGETADIRNTQLWATLNEGTVRLSTTFKLENELTGGFYIKAASFDSGDYVFETIEENECPLNQWLNCQITIYTDTFKYDVDVYTEDGTVYSLTRGADIDSTEFKNNLPIYGLTNVRLQLTGSTATESIIIDDFEVSVGDKQFDVPYITVGEENVTATLIVNEIGAKIFLALYNSNGNLEGVYLSDASTTSSKALTATSLIALPTGGSAKAFLWNANTLIPLRSISVK